jgi:hypothetical protein
MEENSDELEEDGEEKDEGDNTAGRLTWFSRIIYTKSIRYW